MRSWLDLPELPVLRGRLADEAPSLHLVVGPAGGGKTLLLRRLLAGHPPGHPRALHWEVPPLEEEGTLRDLETLAWTVLGPLPPVAGRPDRLPLPGSGLEWATQVEGVLQALANLGADPPDSGPPGPPAPPPVLVLDGMESLLGARRRLATELLELWQRVRDRGLRVHLVTTWRGAPPQPWQAEGELLALSPLSYREAARSHGGRTAVEAFRRWAVFGDHPAHLEATGADASPVESLESAVVRRVLTPGGDLHDAPLRRLAEQVQVPRRYLEILVALADAGGPTGWGPVADGVGVAAGNRLAPYLRRLEDDGWVRVLHPLDGRAGGRRRRYVLADAFHLFWFRHVFPFRSLLHREDPVAFYRERIEPRLEAHLARRLPELTRRWFLAHAAEALPAPPREVGGLWAGEVEMPVVARLANGQICYALCQGEEPADVQLLERLRGQMAQVRWGIGREARAPLVVVRDPPSSELRRQVTRNPLGRLLTLDDLMGTGAPES